MLQLVPSENRAHSVNTVEATSTASPRTRTQTAPTAKPSKYLRPTIARPRHTTATPIRPPSPAGRPSCSEAVHAEHERRDAENGKRCTPHRPPTRPQPYPPTWRYPPPPAPGPPQGRFG